jgi:purine-binding chemotaxis protein CheW
VTETLHAERQPATEHRELLRQRATVLARVPRQPRARELVEGLVFTLGEERFVLEAACVLEVAVLRELTPLPGVTAPLFGVTHWRGRVLTLLDLRAELGVRVRGLTDLGRIIVVDGGQRTFGVLADAVHEIVDVDLQRLSALPGDESGRTSLLRGITADALLVIDMKTLLERHGAARAPQHSQGMRRTR